MSFYYFPPTCFLITESGLLKYPIIVESAICSFNCIVALGSSFRYICLQLPYVLARLTLYNFCLQISLPEISIATPVHM